eukprot:6134100-Pyramimonas_sp.AAC.1
MLCAKGGALLGCFVLVGTSVIMACELHLEHVAIAALSVALASKSGLLALAASCRMTAVRPLHQPQRR